MVVLSEILLLQLLVAVKNDIPGMGHDISCQTCQESVIRMTQSEAFSKMFPKDSSFAKNALEICQLLEKCPQESSDQVAVHTYQQLAERDPPEYDDDNDENKDDVPVKPPAISSECKNCFSLVSLFSSKYVKSKSEDDFVKKMEQYCYLSKNYPQFKHCKALAQSYGRHLHKALADGSGPVKVCEALQQCKAGEQPSPVQVTCDKCRNMVQSYTSEAIKCNMKQFIQKGEELCMELDIQTLPKEDCAKYAREFAPLIQESLSKLNVTTLFCDAVNVCSDQLKAVKTLPRVENTQQQQFELLYFKSTEKGRIHRESADWRCTSCAMLEKVSNSSSIGHSVMKAFDKYLEQICANCTKAAVASPMISLSNLIASNSINMVSEFLNDEDDIDVLDDESFDQDGEGEENEEDHHQPMMKLFESEPEHFELLYFKSAEKGKLHRESADWRCTSCAMLEKVSNSSSIGHSVMKVFDKYLEQICANCTKAAVASPMINLSTLNAADSINMVSEFLEDEDDIDDLDDDGFNQDDERFNQDDEWYENDEGHDQPIMKLFTV